MDRAGLQELITTGEDLYVQPTLQPFRDPDTDRPRDRKPSYQGAEDSPCPEFHCLTRPISVFYAGSNDGGCLGPPNNALRRGEIRVEEGKIME